MIKKIGKKIIELRDGWRVFNERWRESSNATYKKQIESQRLEIEKLNLDNEKLSAQTKQSLNDTKNRLNAQIEKLQQQHLEAQADLQGKLASAEKQLEEIRQRELYIRENTKTYPIVRDFIGFVKFSGKLGDMIETLEDIKKIQVIEIYLEQNKEGLLKLTT